MFYKSTKGPRGLQLLICTKLYKFPVYVPCVLINNAKLIALLKWFKDKDFYPILLI